MSLWDACYGMARNHPDAVFMLYSRLWEAQAVVMRRRDIASGLAFADECFRQAPGTQEHHKGEDLWTSALHGIIYQHICGSVDLGDMMDGEHRWVGLDVEGYISTQSKSHRGRVRGHLRAMGEDGYEVCPLYRYNVLSGRYEVHSRAPAYFRAVDYFMATQANHYYTDRKGLGRRDEILNDRTIAPEGGDRCGG